MKHELTDERVKQGFRSQAELDAHAAVWEHVELCPMCKQVDGSTPLDDGMQPYMKACDEWKRLDAARWRDWSASVPFVDMCQETVVDHTTRLSFQIRVF
jgi:hypothetical protein